MAEGRFYDVPAGTRGSPCRGKDCDTLIYWIKVGEGNAKRSVPIDCDVDGGWPPSSRNDAAQGDMLATSGKASVFDGKGVNHFTTCPNANDFSAKP